MNAKVIKKIIVMTVFILTSFPIVADSGSSQNTSHQGNGSAILDSQAQYPKTKRMPSRNFLEVVYANGFLSLQSNFYEEVFALSFENRESGECYQIPSIQVGEIMPLTLPLGEYQVMAVGEDGSVLSGYMEIF